jgi:hypothetical protein
LGARCARVSRSKQATEGRRRGDKATPLPPQQQQQQEEEERWVVKQEQARSPQPPPRVGGWKPRWPTVCAPPTQTDFVDLTGLDDDDD